MDYKRYEELREGFFREDAYEYIEGDPVIRRDRVTEFIELYDQMHFNTKQEVKKYRELSVSYSIVLQDLLDSVPQARHYYEAMRVKALNIQVIEENEE